MVFLGPGLIVWSFAEHEASSFSNDWVMICTPLLLLGIASLVYFLWRLLGTVGAAVGGLLGVGLLGALFFMLNSSIGERVAYREARERLDDTTLAFCAGAGVAQPDARPVSSSGINPTSLLRGRTGNLHSHYVAGFADWRPEVPRVDATALVACVEERTVDLETCEYSEGRLLRRVRYDRAIQLFALSTGQLVAETVLAGGTPDACAGIEEFYGSGDNVKSGPEPTDEEIVAFLRPFIGD